eukprot:8573769-Pyramimonas_sp.AAC.1
MTGSALYKAKAAPKAKAKAKTKAAGAKPPPMKKAKKQPLAPEEVLTLITTDASRLKYWLDDLASCVFAPLEFLTPAQIQTADVRKGLDIGLLFGLTKEVRIGGTTLTQWKLVRKEIRIMMIKAHGNSFRQVELPGIQDSTTASSEQLTTALIDVLATGETEESAAPEPADPVLSELAKTVPEVSVMQSMKEDQAFVRALCAFLAQNLAGQSPPIMMPVFREFQGKIYERVESLQLGTSTDDSSKDPIKLAKLITMMAEDAHNKKQPPRVHVSSSSARLLSTPSFPLFSSGGPGASLLLLLPLLHL